MFLLIAYFVFAYTVVLILLGVAWSLHRPKNGRTSRLFFFGILLALLSPLSPYALVEAQTLAFGRGMRSEVLRIFDECGTCGNSDEPITTLRVLRVTPYSAIIYYVQPCAGSTPHEGGSSGCWVELRRERGQWVFSGQFDAVWSDCGSAKGNTFPPYPDGF